VNAITSTTNPSVQATLQSGTTAPAGSATTARKTADNGDTVTISEEGKALAKGSTDKDTDTTSSSITTSAGKTAAVSKATLTSTLQSDQTKQKALQAKLDAAKEQAKTHPDRGSQVGSLTAQLNQATAAVAKVKTEVYS